MVRRGQNKEGKKIKVKKTVKKKRLKRGREESEMEWKKGEQRIELEKILLVNSDNTARKVNLYYKCALYPVVSFPFAHQISISGQ